jgi:hypothetical protein
MAQASGLQKLSKEQVIDMAHRLRSAKRNADARLSDALMGFGQTIISTVMGGAMGYWMGGAEYDYNQNATAIDAGDEPDPRQWFGVDKDLLVGFLVALAGIAMSVSKTASLKTAGSFVRTFGQGALAGWAWGAARESALKSAAEET